MGKGYNDSQLRVLNAKGNILVSASAGSGKTTVMIEKIYRLIQEGYDVNRMAVMTFSRASAAEMKNRLVKKLYEAVRRGGKEGTTAMRQLEAFPFANISTIDSFCFGLLKKYYAVTGDDPSATPLDPSESDAMWNECVDKACELAISNGDFVKFAEKYSSGRSLENIKKLVNSLKNFLNVQPDTKKFLSEDFEKKRMDFVMSEQKKLLRDDLRALGDMIILLHSEFAEKYETAAVEMKGFVEGLLGLTSPTEFWARAAAAPSLPICRSSKISASVRESYSSMKSALSDDLDKIGCYAEYYRERTDDGKDVEMLFYVTETAFELYDKRKKRDGKLDFNDLNRIALKILEDEGAAREIRESFDFVFVDEYQDTNYLQESLLRGISREDNVFVVGDIKQAIYKFRYAEPEIFKERMNAYLSEDRGQNIELNENYRSAAAILEFANDVCSEVMTEEYCGIDYRSNPMTAGTEYREDQSSAVEIYVFSPPAHPEPKGVYSVKNALPEEENNEESEFVAARIAELVGTDIYRPKTESIKKAEYGDIAVLTRKGADGLKIAAALAARDIPYTVYGEGDEDFYPTKLLADFMRLCISEDDVPIINVMSCPVFGFTSYELMKIAVREPKTSFWEALNNFSSDEDIRKKIDMFLDYVKDFRKKAAYTPVTELMTKVLSDGLDGYFDSLGRGVGSGVAKFIAGISRLECNKSVEDFLEYYDNTYKGEKPVALPDSVTIMTMHKSKGLEFPIVFMPFCDDSAKGGGSDSFFADKDLGIALKNVDDVRRDVKDTFATRALRMKKQSEERQETARLMYVDFTRAENKLIISGSVASPKRLCDVNGIMGFICYAASKNPRVNAKFRPAPTVPPVEKASVPSEQIADFSYLGEKYRYGRSTEIPNKRSVSEMLEREEEVIPVRGEKGSALLGTAYHLVMQKANLEKTDGESIKLLIEELSKNGEITKEIAQKLDVEKIKDLLDSDIMRLAAKSVVHREEPFIYAQYEEDGYTLVQGVIDLLIEEKDGFTVVDFKASGADEEALKKRYAEQVRVYADAAEKIYAKPVKKKILFNILKNYIVEVD